MSYLQQRITQGTKQRMHKCAKTVHRPTVNATFHRNLNFLVQFMVSLTNKFSFVFYYYFDIICYTITILNCNDSSMFT
ncbi:unnamed protein product [Acanthoscelides obtectus]|uniref:Uncharacterized protein n=1 Tax=Acanthoscelides obtectus TaxID=200917 RepID=A0A9P0KFH1_ACAOB|nr:unnamed protein product [Acanthoscelides obtectus]CAK1633549.1 hypothetical protein AOBTE_LOCUS8217 [Acanthoscelides obtectus]